MATQSQFEADHRTAAQSAIRNPQSAIRPGLLARVVPAETEGWQDLLLSLYESLRPQDDLQRFLVDQIALCMLRLQRSAAWEAQTLARPAYIPLPPGRQYEMEEPPEVPASVRVPALVGAEGGQALLRYENACNRQIKRNLELLMKLPSVAKTTDEPACPFIIEEGAAPSAPPCGPLPLCPEDTRRNATQPWVSHARQDEMGEQADEWENELASFRNRAGVCPPPRREGWEGSVTIGGIQCLPTPSPLQGEARDACPGTFGEGRQDGLLTVAVCPTLPSPAAREKGRG